MLVNDDVKWMVTYKDKSTMKQFDDNKENTFSDIDQEKLMVFTLATPVCAISVYPNESVMFFDHAAKSPFMESRISVPLMFESFVGQEEKPRLVYFVRRRKSISTAGKSPLDTNEYYVGFQCNINGKNEVRLIKYSNGNIFIVDKK